MARITPRTRSRSQGPGIKKGTLFFALILQCILLALTVFVFVLDESEKEPPKFERSASVSVKKEDFKAVERRDRFMKRMQRLQPMQRLSVESAVRGDMRPMAKLPIDAFTAGADVFEIESYSNNLDC